MAAIVQGCADGGSLVPRDPLALSLAALADIGIATETLPERRHQGEVALVTSQLSIGIDQKILLRWLLPEKYRNSGYRMIGWRRTGGFGSPKDSNDLSAHGERIIDSRRSDLKEEHLPEGEYFYTFAVMRMGFLLLRRADVIQFSEVIPSAEYVIGRLEHLKRARELVAELADLAAIQTKKAKARSRETADGKPKSVKEMLEVEFKKMYEEELALQEHLAEKRAAAKHQGDAEAAKDFEAFLERYKEKMIERLNLG